MGFLVKEPGLFTTVQDEGRFGYQQYGVTTSGPMDAHAFHLANLLVGNPMGTETLEMTFSGCTLVFDEDAVVAVTGADMQPKLNGSPVGMYEAIAVHREDELKLGFAVSGCRAYLTVAGGMDLPSVMESKSTLAGKHLGGYEGRKLEAGDKIRFGKRGGVSASDKLFTLPGRKLRQPVYPTDEIVLRVVPGPQDDEFSEEDLRRFFWYGAKITDEFDRMGCRLLREEPLHHLKDGNIISDGIAPGAIQVPPNGQPIIMLSDRQTVGGYTKIGTVISVDLPKLAQSRPGMRVRFVRVGVELAQDLWVRELEELKNVEAYFNR